MSFTSSKLSGPTAAGSSLVYVQQRITAEIVKSGNSDGEFDPRNDSTMCVGGKGGVTIPSPISGGGIVIK